MKNLKRMVSLLLTVSALFALALPAGAAVADTGFSDVPADAWYAESAVYVRDNGVMSGTGNDAFSPDGTMTRAMLAAVLYRAAGSPSVSGTHSFTDVPVNAYYNDAVTWAADNGIISGYGNGLFGVNDAVTREQIATILWRYDGSEAVENSAAFTDAASISAYAVQAVNWAGANGIVTGRTDGSFDPAGNATRAQVAVMLHRYLAGETPAAPDSAPSADSRVLIAYFSRTNNTAQFADAIHDIVGGDLFQIATVEPYPDDYQETTEVAQEELNADARPAIQGSVENMEQYDVVFLGYPIWWGTTPMAVRTFLESYDFTGKTVIPFTTHQGSGLGNTASILPQLCPDATILDGLAIRDGSVGSSTSSIAAWIDELNIQSDKNSTIAVTMTVGNTVITAELTDSETTRDFLALLPRTVTLSRYGDREYYGNPGGTLSENGEAIPDYENGDVTFYPPSGNLAIFFGNEDSSSQSGLIRMGRITSDLGAFQTFGQTIEMTIEAVE